MPAINDESRFEPASHRADLGQTLLESLCDQARVCENGLPVSRPPTYLPIGAQNSHSHSQSLGLKGSDFVCRMLGPNFRG